MKEDNSAVLDEYPELKLSGDAMLGLVNCLLGVGGWKRRILI